MKTPEKMLQRDPKELQRRENYRRAEAFLIWKLGTHGHEEMNRQMRGAGIRDWESLFVEFVEKVEEDLLARTRYIEELHWKDVQLQVGLPITIEVLDTAGIVAERLEKGKQS